MSRQKSDVRKHIERIAGVSRTWFEISFENAVPIKTLVVELEFSTDANERGYRQNVIDAIEETARCEAEVGSIFSHLKIIPKL